MSTLNEFKSRCLTQWTALKTQLKTGDWNAARLKAFALSNTGICIIAGLMVLLLITFHALRSTSTETSQTALKDWNTSVAVVKPKATQTGSTATVAVSPVPLMVSPTDFTALQNQVKALQTQLAATNERLLVLTAQVNEEKQARHKKDGARHPYRLLGVHLDQTTNAWMADIEINDQVQSVAAGEAVDGWHVRNVTAQGAVIE